MLCALMRAVVFAAVFVMAIGCAQTDPGHRGNGEFGAGASADQTGGVTTETGVNGTSAREPARESANSAALQALWDHRAGQASATADYPIGPGDVIDISVPQVEEIQGRKVRVTSQGTIDLPLIGAVQAGGLNESELAAELDLRLERFMYNPQAVIFVEQYRNREAAVVGAVTRPGLVILNSPSETLLDVLTQAGGLLPTAGDELILIPAGQGNGLTPNAATATLAGSGQAGDIAGAGDIATDRQGAQVVAAGEDEGASAPREPQAAVGPRAISAAGSDTGGELTEDAALRALPAGIHPLTLNLRGTSLTGSGRYLNLPARPGDVLVVPGGGNVMVVGWVERPGYFQVGSGLTVLGAIGAAGGPMYAADGKDVTVIRSGNSGEKITIAVDIDQIAKGGAVDPLVKANDVIDVPYSGWRIGPYVFYSIVSRIGLAAPVMPY